MNYLPLYICTMYEFYSSPGQVSHQVRILQGPTEINILLVQMWDTHILHCLPNIGGIIFLPKSRLGQ